VSTRGDRGTLRSHGGNDYLRAMVPPRGAAARQPFDAVRRCAVPLGAHRRSHVGQEGRMTKKARNYNQDFYKVGGSGQPGEQVMPEYGKHRMTQQGRIGRRGKIPPGAPGHEHEA
jgi:hypothetical protein